MVFSSTMKRALESHPSLLRWGLILAIWTLIPALITLMAALQFASQESWLPWPRVLLSQLVNWLPWALVTPWILQRVENFPLERERFGRHILVHLATALVMALVMACFGTGFEVLMGGRALWRPTLIFQAIVQLTPIHSGVYLTVIAVGHGLMFHRRHRQREADLTKARLTALKSQIHPHFLFNTLNTISSLVEEDGVAARWMIARLSALLRSSLDDQARQEVPLAEELEMAKLYLDIEAVRFEDRLRVSFEVDSGLESVLVPHLLLQPLLENAIRHGIGRRADAGRLEVRGEMKGGALRLQVIDDGAGLATDFDEGIGIANIRARLQELYGDAARLSLSSREPRGCVVTVEIPDRPPKFKIEC